MTRPHDPMSPRWDLLPEPLPVDLDVLMATPDGWVPMGRLAEDGAASADLTADELPLADRWSRIEVDTEPITFTVQAEPTAMRDMQLLLGLVTTLAPTGGVL